MRFGMARRAEKKYITPSQRRAHNQYLNKVKQKERFKIGDIVRVECTAIGRYIGNGDALYVSAMTSDLVISKAVKKDKNKYNLPLPSDVDVKFYSNSQKIPCPYCGN